MAYKVAKVKGGHRHIYPGGRNVFVAKPHKAKTRLPLATINRPTVPGPPSSPTAPAAPAPMGYSAPLVTPNIQDASYFQSLGEIDNTYNTQRAEVQAAQQQDNLEYNKNLALLNQSHPENLSKAKQSANSSGLFYSTALGKNLGDIETNYARQKTDLSDSLSQRQAAHARALQSLESAYGAGGFQRQALLQSAAERALARDQDLGVPVNMPFRAPPPPPAPKPKPKPKPKKRR